RSRATARARGRRAPPRRARGRRKGRRRKGRRRKGRRRARGTRTPRTRAPDRRTPRRRAHRRGDEEQRMDKQQEHVLRAIEERDVRFIRLWFTDVLGVLKSVAIAPAELEGAFDE